MNDLLRLNLEMSIIRPDLGLETVSTLDSTVSNFIMGDSVVDPGFAQDAGNTYIMADRVKGSCSSKWVLIDQGSNILCIDYCPILLLFLLLFEDLSFRNFKPASLYFSLKSFRFNLIYVCSRFNHGKTHVEASLKAWTIDITIFDVHISTEEEEKSLKIKITANSMSLWTVNEFLSAFQCRSCGSNIVKRNKLWYVLQGHQLLRNNVI